MQKEIFRQVACLIGVILTIGLSSCCVNCTSPPGMENNAYSAANFVGPNEPSGRVIDGVRVIRMTARQFEFEPPVIRVEEGDRVRLEITSANVMHGFALAEYDISRKLRPNQTEIIAFVAGKPATCEFHCNMFCGAGHLRMKGKLIVEPKW